MVHTHLLGLKTVNTKHKKFQLEFGISDSMGSADNVLQSLLGLTGLNACSC